MTLVAKFCPYCGATLRGRRLAGKRCTGCKKHFYCNPKPVAVAVVRVYDGDPFDCGLLMIKRAGCSKAEGFGKYAFPGGYQVSGETAERAACRELFEEVRMRMFSRLLRLFASAYASKPNVQMTFWLTPPVHVSRLKRFVPNNEASAYRIFREPSKNVAFSSHLAVMEHYFRLGADGIDTWRKLHLRCAA